MDPIRPDPELLLPKSANFPSAWIEIRLKPPEAALTPESRDTFETSSWEMVPSPGL